MHPFHEERQYRRPLAAPVGAQSGRHDQHVMTREGRNKAINGRLDGFALTTSVQ